MKYETTHGVLTVGDEVLRLTDENGCFFECRKYIEVPDQRTAEEIASAMHNLEGRFSWSGRPEKHNADRADG